MTKYVPICRSNGIPFESKKVRCISHAGYFEGFCENKKEGCRNGDIHHTNSPLNCSTLTVKTHNKDCNNLCNIFS